MSPPSKGLAPDDEGPRPSGALSSGTIATSIFRWAGVSSPDRSRCPTTAPCQSFDFLCFREQHHAPAREQGAIRLVIVRRTQSRIDRGAAAFGKRIRRVHQAR